MDVGDGFYGVAAGAAILYSIAAQLLSVIVVTWGFFAGLRARRVLAIVALLILAADHLLVAWASIEIWREIFLGIDRKGSVVWFWNILFVFPFFYILTNWYVVFSGDSVLDEDPKTMGNAKH
jgi:hypothetical protein